MSGDWEIKVEFPDATQIIGQLELAFESGLTTWLEMVAEKARTKAPVRKAFAWEGRSQRQTWQTVFAAQATATQAMRAYKRLYGAMTPTTQQIRVKSGTKSGVSLVQIRTRKEYGERTPDARRSDWSGKAQRGQPWLQFAHYGEMTSNAKWQLRQALQNYRSATEESLRRESATRGEEPTDMALATAQQRARWRNEETGQIEDRALTNVLMKPPRGSAHRETNAEITLNRMRGGSKAGHDFVLQFGGGLKKSIRATEPRRTSRGITGEVLAEIRYARFVEYGTAKHGRAQPFLRPALHESRGHLARIVGSDVRHKLKG